MIFTKLQTLGKNKRDDDVIDWIRYSGCITNFEWALMGTGGARYIIGVYLSAEDTTMLRLKFKL